VYALPVFFVYLTEGQVAESVA